MITSTSIKHPAFVAKIRAAMFNAASCMQMPDGLPVSQASVYIAPARRHGNYSLRVSYIGHAFRVYGAGRSNINLLPEVISAMGARQFLYVHRLADALAQPATEKVW